MVSVQSSPKCQFFNLSQSSKEKLFFREEKNKGERKPFPHKIRSKSDCWMNSVGNPTEAYTATTFQKILSGHLRDAGKEDLTKIYLLLGMKNFPEKAILRQ